jgi:hypothetical protein
MFTILLVIAYSYSLVGSLPTDLNSSEKYIDGTQYTIKNVDATYTQRVSVHGMYSYQLNNVLRSNY